jgi:hypothetical protein
MARLRRRPEIDSDHQDAIDGALAAKAKFSPPGPQRSVAYRVIPGELSGLRNSQLSFPNV